MQKITFYNYKEVHKEIKELCKRNANCTDGTKFYTLKVGKKTLYVIDATEKELKYSEIVELYEAEKQRKKQLKGVIKNIPEIEIEFDEWDLVGNVNIGSYTNPAYEIEVPNFLVTLDLKVEEKSKEIGGFDKDNPIEHEKMGSNIWIYNITITNEDSEKLHITEKEYKKITNAIINNILL